MKISVEGADVQITKLVLHWDNRKDDTLTDVGTLKAGGQTAPADAPGRKGRLKAVTVQYKILVAPRRPSSRSGGSTSADPSPRASPGSAHSS